MLLHVIYLSPIPCGVRDLDPLHRLTSGPYFPALPYFLYLSLFSLLFKKTALISLNKSFTLILNKNHFYFDKNI